jgi:fructose-specific component phosphotransferase system IIB-like protein
MAKISMLIPDADLAVIDEVASPNRTAFMLAAAKEAALRIQRARADAEVARILNESADEDRALLEEFAGTTADGL